MTQNPGMSGPPLPSGMPTGMPPPAAMVPALPPPPAPISAPPLPAQSRMQPLPPRAPPIAQPPPSIPTHVDMSQRGVGVLQHPEAEETGAAAAILALEPSSVPLRVQEPHPEVDVGVSSDDKKVRHRHLEKIRRDAINRYVVELQQLTQGSAQDKKEKVTVLKEAVSYIRQLTASTTAFERNQGAMLTHMEQLKNTNAQLAERNQSLVEALEKLRSEHDNLRRTLQLGPSMDNGSQNMPTQQRNIPQLAPTAPGMQQGMQAQQQHMAVPMHTMHHMQPHGQAQHGQAPHGQAQHGQAQHGQAQHGQAQHGQAQHGQAQHGQAQHGQAPHGQAQHGQAQHGQTHVQVGQKRSHEDDGANLPVKRPRVD